MQLSMHKMQQNREIEQNPHFSAKELTILEWFVTHKQGYTREIISQTKLSSHTVIKYLANLTERKCLVQTVQGNQKRYALDRRHPLVSSIMVYSYSRRFGALEFHRKNAIKRFLHKMKSVVIPYTVILYGSTASGDYTESSDIDLILVTEDLTKDHITLLNEIVSEIKATTGIVIHYIQLRLQNLLSFKGITNKYVLLSAFIDGYPVFGKDLFIEVCLPWINQHGEDGLPVDLALI